MNVQFYFSPKQGAIPLFRFRVLCAIVPLGNSASIATMSKSRVQRRTETESLGRSPKRRRMNSAWIPNSSSATMSKSRVKRRDDVKSLGRPLKRRKIWLPNSKIQPLNLHEYFVRAREAGSESVHDVEGAMRHYDRCDEQLEKLHKNGGSKRYLGVDFHTTAAEEATGNVAPRMPDHITDAEDLNAGMVSEYLKAIGWKRTRHRRKSGYDARSCRNPEKSVPMYRLNTSRPEVVQVRHYSSRKIQTLREPGDQLTDTLNRLTEFDHEEDRRRDG